MYGNALERDDGLVRGERLHVDLAGEASVDGEGYRAVEALEREVVRAAADLLVGIEAYAHCWPLELRLLDEDLEGAHDRGDAGLVVRAQERPAVGRDDGVAHAVEELGVLGRVDDHAVADVDHAAGVALQNPRSHVRPRELRRRIQVRAEPDPALAISRQLGEHVAALVHRWGVLAYTPQPE